MSRLLVMPRRDRSRSSLEASPLRLDGCAAPARDGNRRQRQADHREPAGRRARLRAHRPRQPAREPALPRERHRGPARGARGEPRARAGHGRQLDARPRAARCRSCARCSPTASTGSGSTAIAARRSTATSARATARRRGSSTRSRLDGSFRPVAAVLGEVLEPGPVAQPVPVRRRTARAGSRRDAPGRRPRTRGSRGRSGLHDGRHRRRRVPARGRHRRERASRPRRRSRPRSRRRASSSTARASAGCGSATRGPTCATSGATSSRCAKGCEPTTWFYWYPSGESGLGVEFRQGQVTGVYTLGTHGRLAQHGRARDRRLHEQQGAAGEERVEELPRLQRQARDDAATPCTSVLHRRPRGLRASR